MEIGLNLSPHAGSDVNTIVGSLNSLVISIHTPHAESDLILIFYDGITTLFQSTLHMRGATTTMYMIGKRAVISIHTPHAGSDSKNHIFSNKYGLLFVQQYQKLKLS